MFYLKSKRYSPEGFSTQEENINPTEENKGQDGNDKNKIGKKG